MPSRRSQDAGSASSARVGSVSGDSHTRLNPSIPAASTTYFVNADPTAYCLHLRLDAEQRPQQPVHEPPAAAPHGEPGPDRLHARDDLRTGGVHDVVRVALQQGREREQPVQHRALLGPLQQLDEHERVAARTADREIASGSRSRIPPRVPSAIDRNCPTSCAK